MQGLLGSAAPAIPGLRAPQGYTWGTWVSTLQQNMLSKPVSNFHVCRWPCGQPASNKWWCEQQGNPPGLVGLYAGLVGLYLGLVGDSFRLVGEYAAVDIREQDEGSLQCTTQSIAITTQLQLPHWGSHSEMPAQHQ